DEVEVGGDDVTDDVDRRVGGQVSALDRDLALVAPGGVVVDGHRAERAPDRGGGRDRDVGEGGTGPLQPHHRRGIVGAVAVDDGEPGHHLLGYRRGELDLQLDEVLLHPGPPGPTGAFGQRRVADEDVVHAEPAQVDGRGDRV